MARHSAGLQVVGVPHPLPTTISNPAQRCRPFRATDVGRGTSRSTNEARGMTKKGPALVGPLPPLA